MHFGVGKAWRDVSRRVALVAQHGATCSSRQARLPHVFRGVATACTGVDMSTSRFPEIVPGIDANPEHQRVNLYTRRTTASSWSAVLEQAPLDTSYVSCRDMTWRAVWNLGFSGSLQSGGKSNERFCTDVCVVLLYAVIGEVHWVLRLLAYYAAYCR